MWPRRATALIAVKTVKIVLVMVILSLYRVGKDGDFLGVGGTFNLNEEKSVDVEILASGVFVTTLVYNLVTLVAFLFTGEKLINDVVMNLICIVIWSAVGGSALHYWISYLKEREFDRVGSERSYGLAVGGLSVFSTTIHIIDLAMAIVCRGRE